MFLAIDIGGTNIQFALINGDYKIKRHWEVKTPDVSCSNDFYQYLFDHIPNIPFDGIGIAVPGVVDDHGLIVSKASPRLYPIYQSNIIETFKNFYKTPTSAINDAKAAGICEMKLGAAKHSTSSVSYLIGTGVGGALTFENNLLFGHDKNAGEFSFMPIHYKGKLHSLGMLGSAHGLVYLYKQHSQETISSAKKVIEEFNKNNLKAHAAVWDWINITTTALVQITTIYNPEVILIGGGISQNDQIITMISDNYIHKMRKYESYIKFTTEIKPCTFKNKSNLLGAILYLKQKNG